MTTVGRKCRKSKLSLNFIVYNDLVVLNFFKAENTKSNVQSLETELYWVKAFCTLKIIICSIVIVMPVIMHF